MKKRIWSYILTIGLISLFTVTACKKKETNNDDNNNPPLETTVSDIDGNVYNTITIGTQVWMKENLRVTHYRNGDPIPYEISNYAWMYLTTGAYCNYNYTYNIDTINAYGRLYNWIAVNDTRKICPVGWRVATDADWNKLEKFLDNSVDTTAIGNIGNNVGGILKETGTNHWASPNTGASNSSAFTALPGGGRGYTGQFANFGNYGSWWTSTNANNMMANTSWSRTLRYDSTSIYRGYSGKIVGLSVRCVKE